MSSPMRNTSGLASISRCSASEMASMYKTSLNPSHDVRFLVTVSVGIDPLLDRCRVRHRILSRLCGGLEQVGALGALGRLDRVGVEDPGLEQAGLEQIDRVALGPLLEQVLVHVIGGVVLGV